MGSFLNREGNFPWQDSLKLINLVSDGVVEAFVTRFTLHTIAVKVAHGRIPERLSQLSAFFSRIDRSRGLTVYDTSTVEERAIIELMMAKHLDFDDALQYFVASQLHLTLVSFDRDFDRTDIVRKEPTQILQEQGLAQEADVAR